MTDIAAQPVQPAPVELTREYVSSATDPWLLAYRAAIRALPHYVDHLEAELGDDAYTRMMTDPQVSSSIDLLRAAIVEDEVTLTPATTAEGDAAAAQQASDIAAFCKRVFDGLSTPLGDVLWDMLEALMFGARVAEEVYTVPAEGDDRGRMVLTALKPKPRAAVAFVVDPYLNIVGLLGARAGQTRMLGGVALTEEERKRLLPREKFAILTWRPKNGDPRGSSQGRPAYNPWWIKTQAWPEFLKLLLQFATPSVYGVTGEGAQGDQAHELSPEDLLLAALINLQNGSAAAFQPGTVVNTIEAGEGGAAAFDTITNLLNQEITKAILGSTRATMEAEHGSRADSQTSKGLFDTLVRAGRRTVARMLQRDVIAQLIILNFGAASLPLAPRVAVGGVEEDDKTPMMNAIAALERAGYFDESQRPTLDTMLGLPQRTPQEVTARQRRRKAPPPGTPPGQQGGVQDTPASPGDDEDSDDEEGDDGAA